jgi:membrane fusion protein (multidrug efflux system)
VSNTVPSLRLAVTAFCCVCSLWLTGCKKESASAPAQPVPEVQVIAVTPQTIPDEPEFIGQTESSRPVEIRSQVTGILKERFFSEGRDVKKGERLYQIDPVPFQAAYLSAKAKVAQAQARLVQARQNLERVKPLLAEQAVSQKDVDDAIAEELSAKAALAGANADVVKAKFDLDNTLIVAPISGRIERSRVFEGRLLAAQTDLLTIIHQLDPMYVYASAPETFVLKRFRDRAEKRIQGATLYELRGAITFADGSTYPHQGVLDMLDVGVRTATGTRDFRVTFPNPEKALSPGQFVKLRVIGAIRTDVILVPQKAVQQGPKGSAVFVVGEGDKVELRDVQATAWQGTQWVVQEGLHAGDRVVVDGLQQIGPGTPVKPVPATGPEVSPAPPSAPPKTESAL